MSHNAPQWVQCASCSDKAMPCSQVSFKCTDFLADQVLLGGFAAGGLSQVTSVFNI